MNNSKYLLKSALPIIIVVFFIMLFIFSPDKITFILSAISPLVVSFVIAYLLDSLVRTIVLKLKTRRSQAILLACILVLGIIVLIFSILVPVIIDNANAVVSFFMQENKDINVIISELLTKINNPYVDKLAEEFLQLGEDVKLKVNELIKYISNLLIDSVAIIGSSVLSVVTSFILALYMLIEKDDLIARLKRFVCAFFSERNSKLILETSASANNIFKKFLVGKLLDSLIVGVISIIVFSIFKVPYAPLMGSLIGLFNIIPYFGPIIGAVPVVVVSFFVSPAKALTALIIIIVIGQVDGNFIDPKIVGNNVGVSPFWVISAVVVGGAIAGPVGMILGVPTVVLFKTIIEDIVESRLREKGIEDYEIDKMKVKDKK